MCSTAGAKTCPQTIFPTTETCDNQDNDCDNKIDDNLPVTTRATAIASDLSNCQVGFTNGGHLACENGNPVCRAKAMLDYCNFNGMLDDNSADCGLASATPCTPGVSKCIPSYVCAGSGMTSCNKDNSCLNATPACWHPSDIKAGPNCYTP